MERTSRLNGFSLRITKFLSRTGRIDTYHGRYWLWSLWALWSIESCLRVVIPGSCQVSTLPAELYGPPALSSGGGRIRTHVARTGGRFTVCSD